MSNNVDHKGIDTLIKSESHLWGYTNLDNGIFYTDQVTSSERLVYIAITSKVHSAMAVAFPSYQTLADMTGLGRSTVIRAVKQLIKLDLIEKYEKSYNSNRYMIKKVQESKVIGMENELIIKRLEEKFQMPISEIVEQKAKKEEEKPKNPSEQEKKADPIPYKEIIGYLNSKADRKFLHTTEKECREFIRGRWDEMKRGGIQEDQIVNEFYHVIDVKVSQWKDDQKYSKNLRPSTLFRPGNFDRYRNEEISDIAKPSGVDSRFADFLKD